MSTTARAGTEERHANMDITRSGSQPAGNGPAEWFTGSVRIDSSFQRNSPARVSGAIVTFEPAARTAWHTHPLGQTLIVTSGLGRVQLTGGAIEEIRPGDVVWIEPGEKHWHGASADAAMTHIAIQEQLDGKAVEWLEHVTDEQYRARSSGKSPGSRHAAGRRQTLPGKSEQQKGPTGSEHHKGRHGRLALRRRVGVRGVRGSGTRRLGSEGLSDRHRRQR